MHITFPHFSPEQIMDSGQCFRMRRLSQGAYLLQTTDRVLMITPVTEEVFRLSCTEADYEAFWRGYLDVDGAYAAALAAIPAQDAYLRQAAAAGAGIRILRQDPWEMIGTFILSQRKTIPAIRHCVEKLCMLAGKPIPVEVDGHTETLYSFPTPAALASLTLDQIRTTGAGYRAPYLLETARMVAACEPLHRWANLPDEALQQRLMAFPGVGVKVARCVMLFGYHRLHICPVDVWMDRVIREVYSGVDPFPGYGAFGGIYQQYMFYHAQHLKGLGKPGKKGA